MAEDNGGASPLVREIGDAPNITRLIDHEVKKNKIRFSSWSSPEKFANHIQKIEMKDVWYDNHVWEDANEHFSGVSSIEEALDLCRNGWKEGGETIERTRGYIRALNPTRLLPVKYAIAGSTPNVPRAIAGNILNMRAPDMDKTSRRKTITIVYNMCEPGYVDKETITNKAAVMAALIDEIEAKGFSCEVISTAYTTSFKMEDLTSICVKESHHPVDINRLAFSLGHSAMFRVLFFANWEGDRFCQDLGWGLGSAVSTKPTKEQNEKNIFTIQSRQGLKFFDTMENSATKGLEFIVSELQRQGCSAFEKKDHEDDLEKNEDDDPETEWDDEDEDF
jgi:hypothetical protein